MMNFFWWDLHLLYQIHSCILHYTFFQLISMSYVLGMGVCMIFWHLLVISRVPTYNLWQSVGVLQMVRPTVMFGLLVVTFTCDAVRIRKLLFLQCLLWLFYTDLGDDILYYIIGTTYLVYCMLMYLPPLFVTKCSNNYCPYLPLYGLLFLTWTYAQNFPSKNLHFSNLCGHIYRLGSRIPWLSVDSRWREDLVGLQLISAF